jgi:hypothetical protein
MIVDLRANGGKLSFGEDVLYVCLDSGEACLPRFWGGMSASILGRMAAVAGGRGLARWFIFWWPAAAGQ